jgi:hypothetical protein
MNIAVLAQRLCHIAIWRLMVIFGMMVAVLIVSQCIALPFSKTLSPSPANKGSIVMVVPSAALLNNSPPNKHFVVNLVMGNDTYASSDKDAGYGKETKETYKFNDLASDGDTNSYREFKFEKDDPKASTNLTLNKIQNQSGNLPVISQGTPTKGMGNFDADSRTSKSLFADNISSIGNVNRTMKIKSKGKKIRPLQAVSVTLNHKVSMASITNSILKRWEKQATSISQMNSILLESHVSSRSMVWI